MTIKSDIRTHREWEIIIIIMYVISFKIKYGVRFGDHPSPTSASESSENALCPLGY